MHRIISSNPTAAVMIQSTSDIVYSNREEKQILSLRTKYEASKILITRSITMLR
jgi:hypothetical protein